MEDNFVGSVGAQGAEKAPCAALLFAAGKAWCTGKDKAGMEEGML